MSSLTFVVNTETLTPGTHNFYLIATSAEREDIAKRLNLVSVEKLETELKLEKEGRLILTGKIQAAVTQQCVRTLVVFPEKLEIHVDEVFFVKTPKIEDEDGLDGGELLEGHLLDLGEIVIQLLSLNLDPFPVAPGSEPIEYHDENGNPSPFEVLKKKE